MPSAYYTGLTEIRTAIIALNLTGLDIEQNTPTKVIIRKLPRINEELEGLPKILVVPDEKPERLKRRDFEGGVDVSYLCEVVIVAPTNADYVANLDTYLTWRESIRNRFLNPDSFGSFRMSLVEPGRPLDRSKIREDYDYSALTVSLTVLEQTLIETPLLRRRNEDGDGKVEEEQTNVS